jgi:hypothetical protein
MKQLKEYRLCKSFTEENMVMLPQRHRMVYFGMPVLGRLYFAFLQSIMQHWWNDSHRIKTKYFKENLSQCHSVYHKSYMDWPGIEPRPPWCEAGD